MATPIWRGGAEARAQISTITIANVWAANDTLSVKIGQWTMTLTVGTSTATTDVATALKQAWQGEAMGTGYSVNFQGTALPFFSEITATVNTSVVTLTADTAGRPFEMTVTESTAGSGTATGATPTAATGPNHWDNAANWSTAAVPVNDDEVEIDGDADILYGVDQSALDLDALNIRASFTGHIGLPKIYTASADDTPAVYEYLGRYLKLEADIIYVGKDTGDGSPRINIEMVDDTVVDVYATGTPAVTTDPAVFIKGGASAVVRVYGGTVGIATENGDALSLASLRVSGTEDDAPTVVVGNNGVGSVTAVLAANCTLTLDCATATAVAAYTGATVYHVNPATIATLDIQGGTFLPLGADKTYTTTKVYDQGHFNAGEMPVGGSIAVGTSMTAYGGSTITIPEGVLLGGTTNIALASGVGIAGASSGTSVATLNLPLKQSISISYSSA